MDAQEEIKKGFEELAKGFEEFKKVNEAKLAAIEAKRGHSDFDEKLERINEAMSKQERLMRDSRKELEARELKMAADAAAFEAERKVKDQQFEARVNRIVVAQLGGDRDEALTHSEHLRARAFGEFLRDPARMSEEERKVLTVSSDPSGGYITTPPTMATDIVKAVVLFSPVRQLVTVREIGSGTFNQPKRTQTAAATRLGETDARAETTNPQWGNVEIVAPEMYAESRVSTINLEDSAFNLEQILTEEFGEQFGVKEGAEVISGDGVKGCLGILSASAAGPGVPIAYTASGNAATIAGAASGSAGQGDGIVALFHAVKTAYAVRGTFILNRGSLGKVRALKDVNGQYLWQPGMGGLQAGNQPTILGAPYVECPDMPDEGANTYPIAFGDFARAYTLVDRVSIQVMRDPYTAQQNGQVRFVARKRVGGKVVLGEAIRLLKCAAS